MIAFGEGGILEGRFRLALRSFGVEDADGGVNIELTKVTLIRLVCRGVRVVNWARHGGVSVDSVNLTFLLRVLLRAGVEAILFTDFSAGVDCFLALKGFRFFSLKFFAILFAAFDGFSFWRLFLPDLGVDLVRALPISRSQICLQQLSIDSKADASRMLRVSSRK